MKTTSLSFVENKESRVSSMNQEVIDTTSISVRAYKVGNIYCYANHTFAVWAKGSWKYETTGKVSNHVVFAVTFDGGTQEYFLDSEGIKQKIGDERRAARAVSMDGNGKATKVKRTTAESAAQIEAKYADTIKNVRDKVSKLQDDDRIISALNLLCTMIETAASERIENITNAAKAAHLANVARRDEIKQTLETNKFRLARAVANDDDEQIMEIGKNNKELKVKLLLIEQKIAAYEAAQNEGEETPAALDDNGNAQTSEETPADAAESK